MNIDIDTTMKNIKLGKDTKKEVFTCISYLLKEKLDIPYNLELRSLEYLLKDEPNNIQIKRRMISVYNLMQENPPSELIKELKPGYIQEEYSTDFQKAMQEYADKVGYCDFEKEFFPIFDRIKNYTMTPIERCYALWNSVRYILESGIEGDLMEVGTWRGGSMMLAALEMHKRKQYRYVYIYDTFSGLPRPDEELDVDILGNRAIDAWLPRNLEGEGSVWGFADEGEVRANMEGTGYPAQYVRYVAGKVEETIPEILPEKISLLHIDSDFYSSYRHTLEYAYDRIVTGGVCILDDYGHFMGAKKAVDDFLRSNNIHVLMHRPDYSCRVFIKQ